MQMPGCGMGVFVSQGSGNVTLNALKRVANSPVAEGPPPKAVAADETHDTNSELDLSFFKGDGELITDRAEISEILNEFEKFSDASQSTVFVDQSLEPILGQSSELAVSVVGGNPAPSATNKVVFTTSYDSGVQSCSALNAMSSNSYQTDDNYQKLKAELEAARKIIAANTEMARTAMVMAELKEVKGDIADIRTRLNNSESKLPSVDKFSKVAQWLDECDFTWDKKNFPSHSF